MKNYVNITSITHCIEAFNPMKTAENMLLYCTSKNLGNNDIIQFSKLAFSGNSLGDLKNNLSLIKEISKATTFFINETKNFDNIFVFGTVKFINLIPVSGIMVTFKGEEVGFTPENYLQSFLCNNFNFSVLNCETSNVLDFYQELKTHNTSVLLFSDYAPYILGNNAKIKRKLQAISEDLNIAVSYVSGGLNDTSVPYLYSPYMLNVQQGNVVSEITETKQDFLKDFLTNILVLDFDLLLKYKTTNVYNDYTFINYTQNNQPKILKLSKNPFFDNFNNDTDFLEELFLMQSKSLALRMKHIGCKKIVLALSGGLDSTLAFLVSLNALSMLNLSSENLISVTMPGFGTSSNTLINAENLMTENSTTPMNISIVKSVTCHLNDISHPLDALDVTFENSQARERTQIALDLANKHNAIVVGTGDLSEDALGWCTFGGDHLSNFNVNVCLTKTMIREMVQNIVDRNIFKSSNETLLSILDTPVSPELLPTDNGEISQKTEAILGDYILHDFFVYYLINHNLSFESLYHYAIEAFSDDYSNDYIKEKLTLFLNRFSKSQFKRSCQPDSTNLTNINLLESCFSFSSDINIDAIIKNIF